MPGENLSRTLKTHRSLCGIKRGGQPVDSLEKEKSSQETARRIIDRPIYEKGGGRLGI